MSPSKKSLTTKQIKHVATLAHIPISDTESGSLASAFTETLAVIENLQELDTSKTEETHQVTGLENVLREDIVEKDRMFSAKQALQNARNTHENYFVVPAVLQGSQ